MDEGEASRGVSVGQDAATAALLAAHHGLTPAQSADLDRRLVLMLAAQLDDPAAVTAMAAHARASLGPDAGMAADQPAVLHDGPTSSASFRLRIALELKGVRYVRRPIALAERENRLPAFLARNPQGLVPVLEIDGLVLTQSLAAIGYLEATRPSPPLLPADPGEHARLTAIAHAIAMEIAPLCNQAVAAEVARLAGSGAAGRQAWIQSVMGRGLAAVEAMLAHPATGPFAHGPAPGLVDCCVVPQLFNARRWGVELGAMPRLRAIEAACLALPAFARAHPDRLAAGEGHTPNSTEETAR